MLAYIGYKFLNFLAIIIPYPLAYLIATITARLAVIAKINLGPLKKNISRVLGLDINSKEVHKTAIQIYIHWLKNVVDFLKHSSISREKLKERVEIAGLENLDKALEKGKGVVIFTAHIGNFEWGACRVAVEDYDIWGMGMQRKFEPLNNFFESKRLSKGLNTLYNNKVLDIFRKLRKNQIVAIPTDWDTNSRSKAVDLFGKKARIPNGCIYASLKSGAALIPSFIHRKDKYNHFQIVGKPIKLEIEGEKKELIEKNMAKMTKVLEEYISKYIDQWEMFHDIWTD